MSDTNKLYSTIHKIVFEEAERSFNEAFAVEHAKMIDRITLQLTKEMPVFFTKEGRIDNEKITDVSVEKCDNDAVRMTIKSKRVRGGKTTTIESSFYIPASIAKTLSEMLSKISAG